MGLPLETLSLDCPHPLHPVVYGKRLEDALDWAKRVTIRSGRVAHIAGELSLEACRERGLGHVECVAAQFEPVSHDGDRRVVEHDRDILVVAVPCPLPHLERNVARLPPG